MAVFVLSGKLFDGVIHGTASGGGHGHVVCQEGIHELLTVNKRGFKAELIGFKYYHHNQGERRPEDRDEDADYALTMLVSRGRWQQKDWSEASKQSINVLLTEPGDYIAWSSKDKNYAWQAVKKSTVLTLRWRRKSKLAKTRAKKKIAFRSVIRE